MDAKRYWDMIYKAIENRGLTISEFAEQIGFKRETIYTQRRKNIVPCGEQVLAMQEFLGIIDPKTPNSSKEEYLPYLEKADEATLKSVRKLLDMPTEADKENTFRLPSSIMAG